MNSSKKIEEEINLLKMKKSNLLNESKRINLELEETERKLREQEETYARCYKNFFYSKNEKKFVLYDKYPTFKEIFAYYNIDGIHKLDYDFFKGRHPVYSVGEFNIKELAEIIKLLYSFKRQEDYQILTFGNAKLEYNGPEKVDCKLKPYIHFLIGNNPTLNSYQEYDKIFSHRNNYGFENQSIYNLIALECSKSSYCGNNELGIITEVPHIYNEDGVNYYDSVNNYSVCRKMTSDINIFKNYFNYHTSNYQGIKDTLSFPIHIKDSFIAKALISIVIYKKNIGKKELSNEDYRYIFRELFNEDVDIALEIEKDIPKVLKYVPNK